MFLNLNYTPLLAGLIVLILIIFFGYLIVSYYKKNKEELEHQAYLLVCKAEESIQGYKLGQKRFEYVFFELIHSFLPSWLKLIFTKNRVAQIIERAVWLMKENLKKEQKEE